MENKKKYCRGWNTFRPGDSEGIEVTQKKRIVEGDSCNTEVWKLPNHLGTHVDAPKHFFENGPSIEHYGAEFWTCSNVKIIHCSLRKPRWILPKDIDSNTDTDCILIKTGFQKYRNEKIYSNENTGLSPELAQWLRTKYLKLKFIGMDFISVSRYPDRERGREAHKDFLRPTPPGSPILPIEDMDLSQIKKGINIKSLMVFPLRVKGSSGGPATVVAHIS